MAFRQLRRMVADLPARTLSSGDKNRVVFYVYLVNAVLTDKSCRNLGTGITVEPIVFARLVLRRVD